MALMSAGDPGLKLQAEHITPPFPLTGGSVIHFLSLKKGKNFFLTFVCYRGLSFFKKKLTYNIYKFITFINKMFFNVLKINLIANCDHIPNLLA